ncbi:MAG: ComEC/Rec2 family competence protein [Oscillospiraceae bacterium]|jgi:ComEC/Rec2-related protein|nr:ComEC/Rec2 family competence protein [Oscillospiraceae bacterium]
MKRPLAVVGFTFFFTLMALGMLGAWAAWLRWVLLAVALMFAALLWLPLKRQWIDAVQRTVFTAAALSVVAACLLSWTAQWALDDVADSYADQSGTVSAQITEIAAPRYGRHYAYCRAQSVNGEKVNFRFRLSTRAPLSAQAGDIITAPLSFFAWQNPARRVAVGAYLMSHAEQGMTIQAPPRGIGTWVYRLRAELLRSVDEYLPNEYGGMTKGLMMGEISGLSTTTNAAFRELGISHLIAVSGQHLAIWCVAVLAPLFALLRIKKRGQAALVSGFVLLFMALTGFSDAIVRAGVMLLIMQLSAVVDKRADALNSLGLAVLVICLLNPGAAQGLSLQLSFLATLGILLPGLWRKRREEETHELRTGQKVLASVKELVTCTLMASLFTLPVSLSVSGVLGLLAVPANIVFALPASVALVGSGVGALCALVPGLRLLTPAIYFVCGLCSKLMIDGAKLLSKLPFASLPATGTGMRIWLAGVLVLCALMALLLSRREKSHKEAVQRRALLPLCALLSVALLLSAQLNDWGALRAGTRFQLGTSAGVALVVTRGTHSLVLGVNGGEFNAAGQIAGTLTDMGTRGKVDYWLSGESKEEQENLAALLREYPVGTVYTSSATAQYTLPPDTPVTQIGVGESVTWQGVQLRVWPGAVPAAFVACDGVQMLVLFAVPTDWAGLPVADIVVLPGAPAYVPDCFSLAITPSEPQARRLAQLGINAMNNLQLTIDDYS